MWIALAIIFFLVGTLAALSKQARSERSAPLSPPVRPPKAKHKKVQSYDKWQKKMNRRAGKTAMDRLENVRLSTDDASELLQHNNTPEERRLIDIILDAKLDGADYVKIDRDMYNRLISNKK